MDALRRVFDEELDCAVCLEKLEEPKALPCLHSFCKKCLQQVVQKKKALSCPKCRKEVPNINHEDQVQQLPHDFFKNSLLEALERVETSNSVRKCESCPEDDADEATACCEDCGELLCELHTKAHPRNKSTRGHKVISLSTNTPMLSRSRLTKCKEHRDEHLRLFCTTCDSPICKDCALVTHRTHDYLFVSDLSAKYQREVETALQEMKEQVDLRKEAAKLAIQTRSSLADRAQQVEKEINKSIEAIIETLRHRENQLREQLTPIVNAKEAILKDQEHELAEQMELIQRGSDVIQQTLQRGNHLEIVTMKGYLAERLNVLRAVPFLGLKEDDKVDFAVPSLQEVQKLVESLGEVSTTVSTFTTGDGLFENRIGEVATFEVVVKDKLGNGSGGRDKVVVTVEGRKQHDPKVVFKGNGVYEVSYVPEIAGPKITVHVNGCPVQGSPFQTRNNIIIDLQLNGNISYYPLQGNDQFPVRGYMLMMTKDFFLNSVRVVMKYNMEDVPLYLCNNKGELLASSHRWKPLENNWYEATLRYQLKSSNMYYIWVKRSKIPVGYVEGGHVRSVGPIASVQSKHATSEGEIFVPQTNIYSIAMLLHGE